MPGVNVLERLDDERGISNCNISILNPSVSCEEFPRGYGAVARFENILKIDGQLSSFSVFKMIKSLVDEYGFCVLENFDYVPDLSTAKVEMATPGPLWFHADAEIFSDDPTLVCLATSPRLEFQKHGISVLNSQDKIDWNLSRVATWEKNKSEGADLFAGTSLLPLSIYKKWIFNNQSLALLAKYKNKINTVKKDEELLVHFPSRLRLREDEDEVISLLKLIEHDCMEALSVIDWGNFGSGKAVVFDNTKNVHGTKSRQQVRPLLREYIS